jgi:kanamycin kinase
LSWLYVFRQLMPFRGDPLGPFPAQWSTPGGVGDGLIFEVEDRDLVSRPVLSEIPTGPVAVPVVVRALASGGSITPVWRNVLGGLTFRIEDRCAGTRYAKWVAAGTPEIDLAREVERLAWAHRWTTVPRVIEHGADADGAWLLTAAVPGSSAVAPRWIANPATAAAAIGQGLRQLHDALPVDQCPFDWGISRRRRRVDERIANGGGPADWFPSIGASPSRRPELE